MTHTTRQVEGPRTIVAETGVPRLTPRAERMAWDAISALLVAFAALVGIGAIVGSGVTTWFADSQLGSWEVGVAEWWEAQRTPTLDTLSDLGSALSDTVTVVIVALLAAAVMVALWRRWEEVTLMFAALLLEATTFSTIAWIVGRDRPPVEQLDPSPPTSSFPSGHTAAAVALYFTLALVIHVHAKSNTWSRLAFALATVLSVIVAVSRMYRGMHFVTDVTAGALLGAACVAIAWYTPRIWRTASRKGTHDHESV